MNTIKNSTFEVDLSEELETRFHDETDFTYLRYDWQSSNKRLLEISKRFDEEWKNERTPTRRSKQDMAHAFNVVLTAVDVQGGYIPDRWLRIVTDSEVYNGKTQRSPAHTPQVLAAINWLKDKEYLTTVDQRRIIQRNRRQDHLPQAYALTQKWFDQVSGSTLSTKAEVSRNKNSPYVQVRIEDGGRKKRKVSIPLSNFTSDADRCVIHESNKLLSRYDEIMSKATIKLEDKEIFPSQTSMTRIFSRGSLAKGGRFYHSLQSQKKTQRLKLRVNDQPVIEMDYSSMHPCLLYEANGLCLEGDAYEIDGFERDQVKVAFNVLINRDHEIHKKTEAQSISTATNLSVVQAKKLRELIYEKHDAVKHHFNVGYGLHLQKMDSEIALRVIDYFVNKAERPIIMIHDSAIVAYTDVQTLFYCMRDCYYDVLSMSNNQQELLEVNLGRGVTITAGALSDEENCQLEVLLTNM